jgi:uncharacterized protein YjbI with pentapeptide repeats
MVTEHRTGVSVESRKPPTQDYRGKNYRKANLTGKNFCGANIQGTDFTEAILKDANFTGAKAGVMKRWLMAQFIISFSLCFTANFSSSIFTSVFTEILTSTDSLKDYTIFPSIFISMAMGLVIWVISQQGFSSKAFRRVIIIIFGFGAASVAGLGTLAGLISLFLGMDSVKAIAMVGALAGALISPVAIAGACIVVIIIVVAITSICIVSGRSNAVGALAGLLAAGTTALMAQTGIEMIGGGVSLLVISSSAYVSFRVSQDDGKFSSLRNFGVILGSLGGTSFRGADLTNTNFFQATLKSSNFSDTSNKATKIIHTNWLEAQKLDQARPGNSILANLKVLRLLTTGEGVNQDFFNLNLRGANLNRAALNGANLKKADFSYALLTKADLQNANLTEAQLINSDLTGALLTGAIIESSNFDEATLKDIDCSFVFELEKSNKDGDQERRPHNPKKFFNPGYFETYYRKIRDKIQILIREDTPPEAIYAMFNALESEHGITRSDITNVHFSNESVLLNVEPTSRLEKAAVEETADRAIAKAIKAAEELGRLQGRAESTDKHNQDLKQALFKSLNTPKSSSPIQVSSVNTIGEYSMTNPQNQVATTGDGNVFSMGDMNLSGSTINLGTIRGNLTNSLSQLQSNSQPTAVDLATHLSELKNAIETDTALPDSDKAETLQKVDDLAKAGTTPEDTRRHGAAKAAIDFLKGTITALPKATAFAEACHKLLPLISTALKGLGLPL